MAITPFIVIPIIIACLGLLMIWRGLRGRRADDHPVCRKCGFDLFGLPTGRDVCTECGADLKSRRAIHVGNYARRPVLIRLGMVLTAVWTCVIGYAVVRHVDLCPFMPSSMLARELLDSRSSNQLRALDELKVRLKRGSLSQQQSDWITDRVLMFQGNRPVSWDPFFGEWMLDARGANLMSDERWLRYEAQSVELVLRVPPRVCRSEGVTFYLQDSSARISNRCDFAFISQRVEWDLDGVPLRWQQGRQYAFYLKWGPGGGTPFIDGSGYTFRGQTVLEPALLEPFSNGRHILHALVHGMVVDEGPPGQFRDTRAYVDLNVSANFTLSSEASPH